MKNFPRSIAFVITSACNLRCKMCFQYGLATQKLGIKNNPILPSSKELTLSQIKKIVLKINEASPSTQGSRGFRFVSASFLPASSASAKAGGIRRRENKNYPLNRPSFYITGGEPFMRSDMVEIIQFIHDQGNEVVVNTNFSLINKKLLRKLADLENFYLVVSIDGPEKIHDSIRGIKGLYKKVMGNVKFFSEVGRNRMRINCTISKYNVGRLVDLYKEIRGLNIDFCLNNTSWMDQEHIKIQEELNRKYFSLEESVYLSEEIVIPPEKIKTLEEEFIAIGEMAKKDGIDIFQIGGRYEGLRNYYAKFGCKVKNRICKTHNPTILPDGDVRFCTGVTYGIGPVLGNLLENSLEEVLGRREKIEKVVKERFEKGEIFPVCVKCCFLKDKNEYSFLNQLKSRLKRKAKKILNIQSVPVFPDGACPNV